MRDLKKELGKHFELNDNVGTTKKCEKCGKPLKDQKFKYCFQCNEMAKREGGATLPAGYLVGGYFETKGEKQYIREEVFISWAKEMASALRKQNLTSAAIRRFFSKLRAIEYKYKMDRDFNRAREAIYAFARDVAYTENRGVTPELFSKFIELNISEAKKDSENFKAFIEHFQSVVAYFKDK